MNRHGALDAGTDSALVAGWIAEATAERATAQARLHAATRPALHPADEAADADPGSSGSRRAASTTDPPRLEQREQLRRSAARCGAQVEPRIPQPLVGIRLLVLAQRFQRAQR